jgi:putative transposase
VIRWAGRALSEFFKPRASLAAENLCLRQQLLVLQRRHPRPRLRDTDRRFWIIACRWFSGWRRSLLIVRPETVLCWHSKRWKSYWHWRSRASRNSGRHPISGELRLLIRRMTSKNALWGQRRIQAELVRLGYKVSARTVVKYMPRPHRREPSPGWRIFLKQHADEI